MFTELPVRVVGLALGLLAVAAAGVSAAPAEGVKLYVAPNGRDAWSGKASRPGNGDGPFATLERARDAVRALKKAGGLPAGGVTVELAPGVYELARPFALTAEDSGTAAAPVVYRARPGAEVRLVGGKVVTNWKPVTDPAVVARLDAGARGKVLQADLKALGVTDFGEVATGGKRLELFFQDQPMQVSRWPNQGFVRIVDLVGGAPHNIRGTVGDKIGRFTYDGDRPTRWVGEKDAWLHGYWFWDWADQRQKIESIDTEKRVISLEPPYHTYGYRKNQWYYAFNLLSELDTPGEYFLDREQGILYFWPPAPIQRGKSLVSVLPALVTAENASYVTLRGLILEAARADAVDINGGAGTRVEGCTIRNVGQLAVRIAGATASGVAGCDIYETGDGGISLTGGDRKSLTPAALFAYNNHIHDYGRWTRMYSPGISLNGVGNRASHNLIDNAPHMGMFFSGNDHVIEYNEIHSVCYESNDAGAIYAGRNWGMRGTVIRYNYLHHINGFEGRGCVGVYLDDQFSGTLIYGNLFYKVTRAAMIGGGRDCTIENNAFIDCVPATHVDARGLGWASGGFGGMKQTLEAMPYQNALWAGRYPLLPNILNDEPMAPKGNRIARNICVGGRWGDFEGKAKPLVTFEDNLLEGDPRFVDAARGDFQLRDDSPALKLGFKPLPLKQIGLVHDETRASWPVKSPVRPMVTPPAAPQAKRTGPAPVYKVMHLQGKVTVDGAIDHPEWEADPAKVMAIEQGINGEKVRPRSLAWLAYDDGALYVAVENQVNPALPLRPGNAWGQDDAVEIALRNPAGGAQAPILVLRGYPSGHCESSDEAGAPAAAVKRALEGVEYRARAVEAGRWTCEWRLPWASLGIDPTKQTRLAFNLSVRKSAEPVWVEWRGTGGGTWDVDRAGFIEVVK